MRKYRKPHRIKNKKPIYKEKYFFLAFFGFLLSALAIYFFIFSSFFQVKSIEITGNRKTPKQGILSLVENEIQKKFLFIPTKSIFLANASSMREKALDAFPQIADLEIKKSLPETLNVSVNERIALAVFCQEKCFFTDSEGIIFEEVGDSAGFFKIKSPGLVQELGLGDGAVEKALFSKILNIFSVLADLDISMKEVVIISEERMDVITSENWEIYIDPLKDISWQLTKLEALLKEYVPYENRSKLDYVELRFGDLAPFKYK